MVSLVRCRPWTNQASSRIVWAKNFRSSSGTLVHEATNLLCAALPPLLLKRNISRVGAGVDMSPLLGR